MTAALIVSSGKSGWAQFDGFQELPRDLAPSAAKPPPTSSWRKVRGTLKRGQGIRRDGAVRPVEPDTDESGRLRVTIRLRDSAGFDVVRMADQGIEIEHAPAGTNLIQGTVNAGNLPHIASLPEVVWIGPLDVPIHRAGSVATEGDAGSGADVVRQQGLDGSGVTVGVISDGIDALGEAQATNDLGPVTVPSDARCHRGSGNEGVALLEIVHDLAPGARLLFSGPGSSVEMIDSIRCLTDAGADVIVDDVGFPFEPYFEDGPVADAARAAVVRGVSYHSSAGNDARDYLETEYRPSPSTQFHNFNATPGGPVDNLDTIVLAPGDFLQCVLQWGDAFGASGNDYDLYIFDDSLDVVGASEDVQDGNDDPLEAVVVVNSSSVPQNAHVAINRFGGASRSLKMFCFGASVPQYTTPQGSIFGHPAVAEVVAVGAVDHAEPGRDRVEDFSSRGPVRILFPTEASRPKPTLVALDGVSISNAGGFPLCPPFCRFFGTSAAAPHTAGIAALMLQKAPGLSPAALLSALQGGAVDIENPGFDTIAGAGRLNAIASVALVSPTTTSTTVVTTSSTRPPASTTSSSSAPPTTASTVPSTTTSTALPTTTTIPEAGQCGRRCPDDGDECTLEQCEPGVGCVSALKGRAEGVLCLIEGVLRVEFCQQSDIGRRLQAFIGRKALKAKAHTVRSIGASPGAYSRHVSRALGLLRALARKVDAAVVSGRLRGTCQTQVATALSRTLALAESTTF